MRFNPQAFKAGRPVTSRFVPQSIQDRRAGTRPSMAALLELVDTEEPAFRWIAAELKAMADAGVELDEKAIEIAIAVGRRQHIIESKRRNTVPPRQQIVYYIRRGELIKIGTTSNPASRFDSLMPDEILAHEPGGVAEEALRHRQFNPERVARRGEYFRPSPRLMKHIAAVREQYGPPHPSWPSVSTLGSGYLQTKNPLVLPDPVSGEVMTATQAAADLSVGVSTISQWVRRGRLAAAGRNEAGRPVYPVEHLRYLRDRGRAWQNRMPD